MLFLKVKAIVYLNEVKNEILDYGLFKHFIDIRNSYIAEYMQVITNEGENILHELQEQGVDTENYSIEAMLNKTFATSNVAKYLNGAAKKISESKGTFFSVHDAVLPFVQGMEQYAMQTILLAYLRQSLSTDLIEAVETEVAHSLGGEVGIIILVDDLLPVESVVANK